MKEEEEVDLSVPCLLCSSPGSLLPGEGDTPPPLLLIPGSKESSSVPLNRHLWSVFVLRNLLNFPKTEVEGLLRSMGGVSPGDWYYLCDPCSQLAKEAMELQRQIFELQRRIAEQRADAYDKLRSSILAENKFDGQEGEVEDMEGITTGAMSARAVVREYFRARLRSPEKKTSINLDFSEQELRLSSVPSPATAVGSEEEEPDEDEDDVFWREEKDPLYIPQRNSNTSSNNRRGTGDAKIKAKVKPAEKGSIKKRQMRRRRGVNGGVVGRPRKADNEKKPRRKKIRVTSATPETGGTQCPVCKRWFSPASLPLHLSRHEQSERLRCKLCSFRAQTETGLQNRLKKHEDDPNFVFFKCDKCPNYTCSSWSNKQKHLQKHKIEDNIESSSSSGGEFSCKLCSAAVFESMFKANLHLREAHGPELGLKTFKCPHCPKSCTSNHDLKLHISSVHEKRFKHNCDQCGFGCNLGPDLRNHIATFHSGGKKEFICDICGKELATISGFRSHKKKVHQQERMKRLPLVCKYCDDGGFVASSSSKWTAHMKSKHPELFGIQCSRCPERFMRIHLLLQHEKLRHAEES